MTPSGAAMLLPHLPAQDVLAALGEVSIRHGFLDLILRRTVKTLSGLTIGEVDKALRRTGAAEMRAMVERLAKRRLGKDHPAVLRLKAILCDCERVTERRNQLANEILQIAYALNGARLEGFLHEALAEADGKLLSRDSGQ